MSGEGTQVRKQMSLIIKQLFDLISNCLFGNVIRREKLKNQFFESHNQTRIFGTPGFCHCISQALLVVVGVECVQIDLKRFGLSEVSLKSLEHLLVAI